MMSATYWVAPLWQSLLLSRQGSAKTVRSQWLGFRNNMLLSHCLVARPVVLHQLLAKLMPVWYRTS